MDLIKKIFSTIIQYWNIWISLIISYIWAYLKRFDIKIMDATTSFLTMTLMIIGIITFIKSRLKKKNGITPVSKIPFDEKLVETQKSIHTLNLIENPMHDGEVVGKIALTTIKGGKHFMEKIKKFFTWIRLYWQQLVGLIGTFTYAAFVVYAYIFDKFGFILQYFPDTIGWEISIKIVVGILSVVFVAFMVRNQVTATFLGSVEKAKEYLQNLALETSSELSDTTKSKIKLVLKAVKKEVTELQKTISKFESDIKANSEEIDTIETIMKLGIVSQENTDKYNQLSQVAITLKAEYEKAKKLLEEKQAEIAKYESVL